MALNGKKIVVVMPAYNCEQTLTRTYNEIDRAVVDEVVMVDDLSADLSVDVARELPIHLLKHKRNRGYGGNQKTCYRYALDLDADVIVMLHPDYQYSPKLLVAMASMVSTGVYDCVLGSRILGSGQTAAGMPRYKYVANRLLTAFQNLMTGAKLSEYHTGYRAFSRELLASITFESNSEDFVFDNQMLTQIILAGFRIGEISCPTRYLPEASSINFRRSVRYGFGVLWCSVQAFASLRKRKRISSNNRNDREPWRAIALNDVEVVRVATLSETAGNA